MALVHRPEVEVWTRNEYQVGEGPMRRVGINFGAPGDRKAPDGTLWLDHPSVGGPSPDIPLKVVPDNIQPFRHHSLRIQGDRLRWVAASGVEGLESVTIPLGNTKSRSYTVRLYFTEPEDLKPGERVFSVRLQGEEVLKDLDIVKEAGSPNTLVAREFRGIAVESNLEVTLTAAKGKALLCGIEAVLE